ncbi:SxtJ family membrane protein [Peristeroidobacter soli]|uniref:SxtJ family membrane protein n=1 Tax=Peristeroidobacter soli TaxID=2497877 RepID=UPI00389AE848
MEPWLSDRRPSDRKFGFTFGAILFAVSAYGTYRGWPTIISSLCTLTGVSLALLAWLAPSRLSPVNRAWFAIGELLGRVVSPIALGFIFFALITPVSIIARLFGRDELHLNRRPAASYWIPRETTRIDPCSFRQQF